MTALQNIVVNEHVCWGKPPFHPDALETRIKDGTFSSPLSSNNCHVNAYECVSVEYIYYAGPLNMRRFVRRIKEHTRDGQRIRAYWPFAQVSVLCIILYLLAPSSLSGFATRCLHLLLRSEGFFVECKRCLCGFRPSDGLFHRQLVASK